MSIFKKKLNQTPLEFPDNKVTHDVKNVPLNYVDNDESFNRLVDTVVPKLIAYFEEHYNLFNNKEFQEEMDRKKNYLNKLDNYLVERREFKTRIEKELALFLSSTKSQMEDSLNKFSHDIVQQVSNMEVKHQVNDKGTINE